MHWSPPQWQGLGAAVGLVQAFMREIIEPEMAGKARFLAAAVVVAELL